MCHDENYLACQGSSTIETCTVGLKRHRDTCSVGKEISTGEMFGEAMLCMVLKHSEVSSMEEFEVKCDGGVNVNFTKAKEKVMQADPEWVKQLLK